MSIVINTNTTAMSVQGSLGKSTNAYNASMEKLSTGLKINKAADDAAGLAISQTLEAQKRGSTTAKSNCQQGINMLQTAEGDLGIIQENLQRIRDLTIQAANGTNGTEERNAIDKEVEQRLKEISRIAEASKFNEVQLLNGDKAAANSIKIQVGGNDGAANNQLDVSSTLADATATALGVNDNGTTVFGTGSTLHSSATADAYLTKIDSAIETVSGRRATIGSMQNRLNSAIDSLTVYNQNMAASQSSVRDVDVAQEAANMTKEQILQQTSSTLLAQANQSPSIALSLI